MSERLIIKHYFDYKNITSIPYFRFCVKEVHYIIAISRIDYMYF